LVLKKEQEMKKLCMSVALAALAVLLFGNFSTKAKSDDEVTISAGMVGLGEVPPTNSKGAADFHGTISSDGTTITYTLKWSGLTTLPLFSHIHFGPTKENGGVMVFLCGGGGKPPCTQATSGMATGTIIAADIVGPAAQGIPPAPNGSFADVIRAIRTHNAYANLHTTMFTGGEVRGEVFVHRDRDEDDE
jgi:hypothetical protein